MENYQKLYNYIRHYGISFEDYQECLYKTSLEKGISVDEVIKYILSSSRNIIQKSIQQAKDHNMKLKDYQELAVKFMAVNRGMIAAFDVGTGKTLTAVAVSDCILNLAKLFGRDIKVIVITPTSLQKNFKKEMIAYGNNPNDKRYRFYTVAKFGIDYKKGIIDCSSTLFIIDEAHTFRKDYRNIFSEGPQFGQKIDNTRSEFALMCSKKAWKVLLLTATPLYNKSYDIINLVSMIKGINPPYDIKPLILQEQKFLEQYSDTVLFQKANKEDYPLRKNILVQIFMTDVYKNLYDQLERKIKNKNIKKDGSEIKNAFFIAMRKASNKLVICLKCEPAMKIIRRNQKTIFYSCFLSYGVQIIIEELKKENIPYYLIDGSLSMKARDKIVIKFNSDPSVKLLLITKAGGEGLDLKEVRNVIIFERGWNFSSEEQVIGRAIRYKSHENLPEEERVVKVFYIMVEKQTLYDIRTYIEINYKSLLKYYPSYDKVIQINKKFKKNKDL